MTRAGDNPVGGAAAATARPVRLSVDAMGGDRGPSAVVDGMARMAGANPDARFLLHGDEAVLAPLVGRHGVLAGRVEIRHAAGVVSMEDKPSQVMRHGKGTSMWSALAAVRDGAADVAVSCGNTGALMALSMLVLRRLPGVPRPAIAILWPSRNPQGYNVMLDVGADVKAEAEDLRRFALMGTSYARNGLGIARPRIGLMNVGTEAHKGRPELHEAAELIAADAAAARFDYVGFVEGSDIPSEKVDVIVTDGFTGNVALKTAEGTATFIRSLLREAFTRTPPARLAALTARGPLGWLARRIDPRRANGGVFLGLRGTVVKSHGSADRVGVAAALELACRLARSDFSRKLALRLQPSLAAEGAAGDREDEQERGGA